MPNRKSKVAYLGPGTETFGFQALSQYFSKRKHKVDPVPYSSHRDICDAVGRMIVDYGVVAIENVIDGVVAETVRSIEQTDYHYGIKISGEEVVKVHLYLMSKSGELNDIKRILSHRTGLNQCSNLIARMQEDGIEIVAVNSTAEAARIAGSDPATAAIASNTALKRFGLNSIIPESVTDHMESETRFWVIGKRCAKRASNTRFKTCFLANFDRSMIGALEKTLALFANRGVNVCLLYPSPILGKKWEYTFVIEVEGHIEDEALMGAWEDFRLLGIALTPLHSLGSYVCEE